MALCNVPVSLGELYDKYSILEIKFNKIQNIELNKRNEGIYNHNFLDNASEDLPKGTWSILQDTFGKTAVIRSKLWPGYYAYH
jgi:hypothetical protein